MDRAACAQGKPREGGSDVAKPSGSRAAWLRRQAMEVALPDRSPRGRRCAGKPGSARDGEKYKGDANGQPHAFSFVQNLQELPVDREDFGHVEAIQQGEMDRVAERGR